ncbi:MalY/PatB family protein [Brachybacterium sp. DNPG3]
MTADETAYDFETLVDRTAMGSSKWIAMHRTAERFGADLSVPEGAEPIAPFSVADLDLPQAPEIVEAIRDALADGFILGYSLPTPGYRDAVAGWLRRRHGWDVDPAWIRTTPGVIPAFTIAIRTFTAPGDGIILPTPSYYPMFGAIEKSGRRIVRSPLVERDGRWRLDLELLEEQAKDPRTTMLLFCSPHNPTGRVWEREELEAVARIALDNDLLIVSDEIHFDLVQPGHEHTVLATLGEDVAARTITLTSPSKSFNIAGLQLANAIVPDPALRERFGAEIDALGFDNPGAVGAIAAEAAYTRAEPWLDALIALVGRNHELVKAFFAEHFPQVRVADLEGTYLQWLDLRGLGFSADELERIHVVDALLFLDEGPIFGPEGEGFTRVVLATPTHVLEAALERLRLAYDRALAARG